MERTECEFFLVRYVADPVRDEFVNIAVLLREAGRPETTAVRFTRDWSRVRCVDPDADTAMLEALEAEMRARLIAGDGEAKPVMEALEDSLSNSVQLTEAKGYLAESMSAGLERLSELYVEPRRLPAQRKRSARQAIAAEMRSAFERAGVWPLMRKRIRAAEYTRPGDPLRIDCGYRPNGVVRLFHAVSLDGDLEAAKVLAFSVPELSAGMLRVEQAVMELTAVVEPWRSLESKAGGGESAERLAQYRFGVDTMERSEIRVLTVGDLPGLAETARRELRI